MREYKLDSLLKNYGMVFQNVYLFNDTIANNIRFGKPDASMEEVIEAAKKACCHDFISALPDGYDTVIGEGGASISGGEKQRISIARAIIKRQPRHHSGRGNGERRSRKRMDAAKRHSGS